MSHDQPPLDTPKVSLSTFVEFLAANASEKIETVRRQRETYGKDFVPGGDFYSGFKRTVKKACNSHDDEGVLRRLVDEQSQDVRRKHYGDLGEAWLKWVASQSEVTVVPVGRSAWHLAGLTINISPDIAFKFPNGQVVPVMLWLKSIELGRDSRIAAICLMQRHMPQIHEGGVPGVLDVRRQALHLPDKRRRKRGFDAWLEAEAGAFLHLWNSFGLKAA